MPARKLDERTLAPAATASPLLGGLECWAAAGVGSSSGAPLPQRLQRVAARPFRGVGVSAPRADVRAEVLHARGVRRQAPPLRPGPWCCAGWTSGRVARVLRRLAQVNPGRKTLRAEPFTILYYTKQRTTSALPRRCFRAHVWLFGVWCLVFGAGTSKSNYAPRPPRHPTTPLRARFGLRCRGW